VPGSLEVYPIKNYGAIEVGSHRFCHDENGRTECGTFKFLHVWRKTGTTWRLSRIVSYAHYDRHTRAEGDEEYVALWMVSDAARRDRRMG